LGDSEGSTDVGTCGRAPIVPFSCDFSIDVRLEGGVEARSSSWRWPLPVKQHEKVAIIPRGTLTTRFIIGLIVAEGKWRERACRGEAGNTGLAHVLSPTYLTVCAMPASQRQVPLASNININPAIELANEQPRSARITHPELHARLQVVELVARRK
jgi:hypothetical protein